MRTNGAQAPSGFVTRSTLTGVWVASRRDGAGNVVEEQDFGSEYDAREWLAAAPSGTEGPKLLLADGEGWSALYAEGDAAKLGEAMRWADLAGEPLFTRAYLVLPDGSVVPTKAQSRISEFDEEDYARASITFTPDPFWPARLNGVAARAAAAEAVRVGWSFRVAWTVDGRS